MAKPKPFASDGTLNVIIETPRGMRNKFKYEPRQRVYSLSSVLPAGSVFPYDFGFTPGTKAPDGDPIDVLLLMDEAAFPGCHVKARLVGIIEAEQTENGQTFRNDRLLAVAVEAHDYRHIHAPKDINTNLLKEIEHFFISYNETRGRRFKLLRVRGPKRARRAIEEYRT